ncbi:hypothetical protein RN001_011887 [Aquatica leii]|uniref:Uncharacterized protein n=1 Tax=Aquatica leii TaxID=1421715 RepID=A0AAN7Q158_9COLE|nr:hypothetical protein RN001_011887 [Aquatica leii]
MRVQYMRQTFVEVMFVCVFLISCAMVSAFPTTLDDDRMLEREQYMTPGAHQLASWLTYQLRKNNYLQQSQDLPVLHYRLSGSQGKRNSELTNSMMGIPRNMIDNGKK